MQQTWQLPSAQRFGLSGGQALVQIVTRKSNACTKHGRARPSVEVICDERTLQGLPITDAEDLKKRICTDADGTPLPPASLARLLCGADLHRLVVSADGGGPDTPSGLDALLTYVPEESGTYYINARAYDTDAVNGTTGDAVGDYELFVNDVTGRPTYLPYYDADSPIHSIDWGSQVDRTSRNPDGQEGPRITGNEFTGVGLFFAHDHLENCRFTGAVRPDNAYNSGLRQFEIEVIV